MTFYPAIQSLIGPQTPPSVDCCVDWARNNVFMIGNAPDTNVYLACQNLLNGTQNAYQLCTAYTTPAGSGGLGVTSLPPLCVDGNGDVYQTWYAYDGGGLIQCDRTTLNQIAVGGSIHLPPSGFITTGSLSGVPYGNQQFIVALALGGNFGGFQNDEVLYINVTYAGLYEQYGGTFSGGAARAISCAGKDGSGFGFVVIGPADVSGTQQVVIETIQCYAATVTTLVTIPAASFGGSWTKVSPLGVCIDQTDGHILLWVQSGPPVSGTVSALVKINHTTGAIIWNTPLPLIASAYQTTFQFSRITNQRIAIITGFFPCTVTTIDTSDGTYTTSTTGLGGMAPSGSQCYNDTLGAIVLSTQFAAGVNAPTKLGNTPDNFAGWAVLYANPAIVSPISSGLTASKVRVWGNMMHS
jgi:hypothetical protein